MSERIRVVWLIVTMAVVSLLIEVVTVGILYQTAFKIERERLVETVSSQARLIEAVFRFDSVYSGDYPGSTVEATLSQIIDAHKSCQGFGETGEFTLSRRVGDQMVFLLRHRCHDSHEPKPIPFDSRLAEPMRLALSGRTGTIVGLDYRGETVLAAYEPVAGTGWGIVAKTDIEEVRAPFIKASLISAFTALLAILAGAFFLVKITSPLFKKLHDNIRKLEASLEKVKMLGGLLPICSSCKKIRDDKGYWNNLEQYIKTHSEADFSHGICPECARKLYPELNREKIGE